MQLGRTNHTDDNTNLMAHVLCQMLQAMRRSVLAYMVRSLVVDTGIVMEIVRDEALTSEIMDPYESASMSDPVRGQLRRALTLVSTYIKKAMHYVLFMPNELYDGRRLVSRTPAPTWPIHSRLPMDKTFVFGAD